MKNKSFLPITIFIVTVGLATIALSGTYFSLINHQHSEWNTKKEIVVGKNLPAKRITYVTRNPKKEEVAKIIFDLEEVQRAFENPQGLIPSQAEREEMKKIQKELLNNNDFVIRDEFHLPDDWGTYLFVRSYMFPLITSGKIILYDIKNMKYVDFFTIQSTGSYYQGIGGRSTSYQLPSGEVFIFESAVS